VSELAEPCRECRAPLVPGQRYCLYCGTRRPDARLEFLDVLAEDRGPAAAAAAAAPAVTTITTTREPGVNGWLRQNSPVLALTGLILGTLLIGLLIGHWATGGDDSSAPAARAAAPQVIRVDAGTAAPATTTADAAATDGTDTAATAKTAKKDKAKADKPAASADDAKATAAPAAVSVQDAGDGADGQKAIEQAAKKGQPISTGGGGKLPPTDDKAPAGGTSFETIG
jgi:hypothetical protein